MAISTVSGADVNLHQKILELLQHRLEPKQYQKLLNGEYQTATNRDLNTNAFVVVIRDQNTIIHKEIISEDLLIQEKNVSNKFLPFVVENSTPLHIFKTLLSRSKGMNKVLVASTFNLILNVDIKNLRENVKEMPEMPLEKLYGELLIKYPMHRVNDGTLAGYQCMPQFFPNDAELWGNGLEEYETSDAMIFFCAMAQSKRDSSEYSDFPYHQISDSLITDPILDNVQKYVQFSDQGTKRKFGSTGELRAFILYHAIFRPLMEPDWVVEPFKAEFGEMV